MENKNIICFLTLLLGLMFIIFPIISITIISIFIGVGVVFLSLALIFTGFKTSGQLTIMSPITILLGLIGVIFGLAFIFNFNAVSVITGLQFYVLGFLFLVLGISGLVSELRYLSSISSLIMIVFGFVSLLLGVFAFDHPEILAIFIGLILVLQSVRLYLSD